MEVAISVCSALLSHSRLINVVPLQISFSLLLKTVAYTGSWTVQTMATTVLEQQRRKVTWQHFTEARTSINAMCGTGPSTP